MSSGSDRDRQQAGDSPTRQKIEILDAVIKRAGDIKKRCLQTLDDENILRDDLDRLYELQEPDFNLRNEVGKRARIADDKMKARGKAASAKRNKQLAEKKLAHIPPTKVNAPQLIQPRHVARSQQLCSATVDN